MEVLQTAALLLVEAVLWLAKARPAENKDQYCVFIFIMCIFLILYNTERQKSLLRIRIEENASFCSLATYIYGEPIF